MYRVALPLQVRRFDNCIIVCSIENLDPMGVHTGDSITIAPALTLTDKEYQRMRDASFKILREIGVDTGGSNVQFAINPKNGRMTVIEMNPRVSRSSALASKATGYPIAKVATMLAVGFSLDEIKNDITGTPASFEPSIDYIVTKIPRFTFEKFPQADSTLTTSMKSIGEVMAIGGSFKESLQKALCSLETGIFGLNQICNDLETIKKEIRRPNANRLLYIAEGFGLGMSIEEMHELCKIDKWFLHEIKEIVDSQSCITSQILSDKTLMRRIKSYGFSDKMIAHWLKHNDGMEISESEVYQARVGLGVECVYNEVDTCAAEFPSLTPYLYSTIGNFMSVGNSAFERFCGSLSLSHCDARLSASHSPETSQPTNSSQNPRINANSLLYIAEGFGLVMSIEEMLELCKIDQWFLHEIKEIVDSESGITSQILSDETLMRRIKSYGFSDKMIAHWLKHNDGMDISESEVYQARVGLGVECVYNEVDTCAAEFPSLTPYLYSTIGNFVSVGNSAFERFCGSLSLSHCDARLSVSHSPETSQPTNSSQNPRIADSSNTDSANPESKASFTNQDSSNSKILSKPRI